MNWPCASERADRYQPLAQVVVDGDFRHAPERVVAVRSVFLDERWQSEPTAWPLGGCGQSRVSRHHVAHLGVAEFEGRALRRDHAANQPARHRPGHTHVGDADAGSIPDAHYGDHGSAVAQVQPERREGRR